VAGDLAVLSNGCVLLDFNKGSDFGVLSDLAAVKVDEFGKLDSLRQFHIWSNRAEFIHRRTNSPSLLNKTISRKMAPRKVGASHCAGCCQRRAALGQATAINGTQGHQHCDIM
jgi:hypothetical protein